MTKTHSRFRIARNFLLFWCFFIGIGAVVGSSGMLIRPDGSILQMQGMLPYYQVLPFADLLFQDYIFSGIALFIVNGITNLTAGCLLLMKKKAGVLLGGLFGVTLMLWITIQFVIFPANPLSISFFIFGILQAAAGYCAYVFMRQESFSVRAEDYPNIGTDPRLLVVWFSRMGYTKKYAYEEANRTGAVLYEVRSTERTEGTPGFWWCGRYGMHRWRMPIAPVTCDLSSFDHVTVCTPVWVFHLCAPMRSFLAESRGKLTKVSYIIVHHQRGRYENVAREMNELLGVKADKVTSICFRIGKEIKRTTTDSAEKAGIR